MKRVLTGTCLAAAFAVGLSAQTPSQQYPSQAQADKDAKSVTLTGCVRAGEAPNSFVLANIKSEEKSKAGEATGTSGATSSKSFEGQTLRLIGAPSDVKLSEHVGHTVQITGTLSPSERSSASSGTGAGATGAGATGTAGSEKPQQSINVKTVSMVSSSCSE